MNQLVIGLGEVGSALRAVLGCDGYDPSIGPRGMALHIQENYIRSDEYDVLHIAFPYSTDFVNFVKNYQEKYGASLVIVHSTVPVGTCDPRGWVHSPIRGVHPHLEKGIRTFTKFMGGEGAVVAAGIFQAAGLKTLISLKAADCEAMKLWDTTIYGWNILIQKAIKQYCEKLDLDFETVYTLANATYNEGYQLLGMPQYTKYVLQHRDGPIGGHCVLPNLELLDELVAMISKDLHKRLTDS